MNLSMNPITKLDYPDVDVIRVEDTYYMVSTTMHFMPGCEILRSYDLLNWEHATYVYNTLDSTEEQRMVGDQSMYGQGMWAASLRHHNDMFYVCFVANDTHKTYLYTSKTIEGPWMKQNIEGFYHDCSLLFDDDGKVYIVYGNREIWLTELNETLTGPKEGGLHRRILCDDKERPLGLEGSHMYKINGKYYVFFIHSRADRWMRTEACFMADSLDGEFTGGDVFEDDRNYCGSGVAQGGIVDTPNGDWYAILFQDSGAVGRLPILLPIHWENDYPVFGVDGRVPETFAIHSTKPDYRYEPLVGSDDFKLKDDKKVYNQLLPRWQFNHEPWEDFMKVNTEEGYYEITAAKLCKNVTEAPNTLTQRMRFPSCEGTITIDASNINEGDYAGLCAFQSCYGMVAITKQQGKYQLVMQTKENDSNGFKQRQSDHSEGQLWETVDLDSSIITLKVSVNFDHMKDESEFFYQTKEGWKKIGPIHKLHFRLDHFCGARFGLFYYATKELGGTARFSNFEYKY